MHTEALRLALEALIYHTEMTRPIQKTADAMVELRAALAAPAAVPVALDYMALMDAATLRKLKPGTGACIAFKHGAEWAHARYAAPAAVPVALWQYRWTNPGDNPNTDDNDTAWKEVRVAISGMQTMEQRIEELRAYRYNDRPTYEVRALYAAPAAPSMPAGLTEDDMHALMGHAVILHGQGQTDMPAYFFDLAARIAPDKAHADQARELWAKLQAASAAAAPTDGAKHA